MPRYYEVKEVNALIERLLRQPYYQHKEESWYAGVSEVGDSLMDLKVVEIPAMETAIPVGRWISASTKPGVHAGMKCSLCKARISYSEHFNGQHRYCHKCGAKMIKE